MAGWDELALARSQGDVPRVVQARIGSADCFQVNYVRGGHGAGIVESQWD